MSTTVEIIHQLLAKGIILSVNSSNLDVTGEDSALNPDFLEQIRAHKAGIIELMNEYNVHCVHENPILDITEKTDTRLNLQDSVDLKALAGIDWDNAKPEQRQAFAKQVAVRKLREKGERPHYYTQKSACKRCGPIWLWEGALEHVEACVWCFNRVNGIQIPRPESII